MFPPMTVRVPASSANLGPGFDTLGIALSLYLECRVKPAERLSIRMTGRDVESIPVDENNLIWRTAVEVATSEGREMPPVELEVSTEIPLGKGLGSSASALVAGAAMANRVVGLGWDDHRILDVAARMEGHPDNVAAAVLGSFTTAAVGPNGLTQAIRLEIPDAFSVAVVCPDFELETKGMRGVLPNAYSKEDAVFNLQRATLLVAAFATGSRCAFPEALSDRMHQPYRMGQVPGMEEILNLRAPGLLGCALSGAGPSILVLYETGSHEPVEAVKRIFEKAGRSAEVMWTTIDRNGLKVSETD
jgi:homoserine kinase